MAGTTFDDWKGDSLCHYGVLGMKWGIRRYENKDGTLTEAGKKHYEKTGEYGYTYKSHATKKYDRKAAKAEAKGDSKKAEIYKNRANKSRELDRKEEEYARNTKRPIGGILLGKGYTQQLAMLGNTKGGKILSTLLSVHGGSNLSRLTKAGYLRAGENSFLGEQYAKYFKIKGNATRILDQTIDELTR